MPQAYNVVTVSNDRFRARPLAYCEVRMNNIGYRARL